MRFVVGRFKIESKIKKALKNLGKAFRKNELAYLALTSKPELPFRDRLAFQLHEQLKDKITVAREWKRIDLAFLEDNNPLALLQLKAHSLFTFIKKSRQHVRRLTKDIRKCRKHRRNGSKIYSLLVATHIEDDSLLTQTRYKNDVIKYLDGWRKAVEECGSCAQIENEALKRIGSALAGWRLVDSKKISAGTVFDARVSVRYWLCDSR